MTFTFMDINTSLFVEDKRKISDIEKKKKTFSLKCYFYDFILIDYRAVLSQICSK